MNAITIENEKNYPELKKLRRVILNENESDDRRCWAAYLYTMMALAIYKLKASP